MFQGKSAGRPARQTPRLRRNAFSILLWLLAFASAAGQETDSSYLKSLRDGEALLRAGRYAEAAQTLEIAAFGLHRRPDLLAKSQAYQAYCQLRRNDASKAEAALAAFQAAAGEDGLGSLDLPSDLRPEIERLVGAALLRAELQRDPKATGPAFALAAHHVRFGEYAAAQAVLRTLLAVHPESKRAELELGKTTYFLKDFKSADKMFLRVVAPAGRGVPSDPASIREAKAYLLLCADSLKDAKDLAARRKDAAELRAPGAMESLALRPEDASRLAAILGRKAPGAR